MDNSDRRLQFIVPSFSNPRCFVAGQRVTCGVDKTSRCLFVVAANVSSNHQPNATQQHSLNSPLFMPGVPEVWPGLCLGVHAV